MGKHLLIKGDNLSSFLEKESFSSYHNDIDVIYIDPPYNTKTSLTYADKFKSHQDWVDFMSPRLIAAKPFLTDNGLIFVSIDNREYAYLKILMDSVYGEDNFIANFIWKKTGQQQNNGTNVANITEYILCYAKESVVNGKKKTLLNKENIANRKGISAYRYTETTGIFQGQKFRVNPIQDKTLGKHSWSYLNPITNKSITGEHWRLDLDTFTELDNNNMIYWGTGKCLPQVKKYLDNTDSVLMSNIIDGFYNENGKKTLKHYVPNHSFDFPKPVELIAYLLKQSLKKDKKNSVLDFFAGSGTTTHAAMLLNQQGFNIDSISITLDEGEFDNGKGLFDNILLERINNVNKELKNKEQICLENQY